jgi:hypothetical protein
MRTFYVLLEDVSEEEVVEREDLVSQVRSFVQDSFLPPGTLRCK